MNKYFNKLPLLAFLLLVLMVSCKKDEYSFGDIKTPSGVTLTANIMGKDATNPNGDGTGKVAITAAATNALTYTIDYGDGVVETIPSGIVTHKYSTPGTNAYTITVKAVGTGGAISTLSKQINVLVNFEIPANIVSFMTGGANKVWVSDKNAQDHFGVGPTDGFTPSYYGAPPNTREACAYDDEVTFTKTATGQITMTVNNMGQSMSIGAATVYYGFSGADGCFPIPTPAAQALSFSDATSASTLANSTRIQFRVPGKGNIIFGTGGSTYEILSISATNMFIRNIGIDGLAWYQKLKVK